jgi:hypothetical protein
MCSDSLNKKSIKKTKSKAKLNPAVKAVAKSTSVGVTAFIDILGFGARVLDVKSFEDLVNINNSVELIREAFDCGTVDDLTKKVQKIYKKTVLAFSDSVIVNFPIKSGATKYEGTFDPVMSEISGFGMAQGTCVKEGLFIRGGVDLGWWYQSGKTLISQSLTRAYYSEGMAGAPVLALTDNLYKFLAEHSHRDFYAKDADPINDSFRKYEGVVKGKNASFWYIDYLRICLESIGWVRSQSQLDAYKNAPPNTDERQKIIDAGYCKNIDDWLTKHAVNIKTAHTLADKKSQSKYVWLAAYHNEYAEKYSSNENCFCNL